MKFTVPRNAYIIAQEQRDIVSERYKRVTAAINNALWHTASDTSHGCAECFPFELIDELREDYLE